MQAKCSNSNYGKCRCCLAKGKHPHTFGENYIEMLRECLNLFLVTDSRVTQIICSTCIAFLRDVSKFREKVKAAEKQLLSTVDKQMVFVDAEGSTQSEPDVKEELRNVKTEEENEFLDASFQSSEADNKDDATLKTEFETCSEYQSDMERFEDIEADVKYEPDDTIAQVVKSKANILKTSHKDIKTRKSKRKKYDSESDTPIALIKAQKAKNKKIKLNKETSESKTDDSPRIVYARQEALKDNNKVRSNILLILKHSTIVPFVNNFKCNYNCFYCEKKYITFKELKEHIRIEHVAICESTIDTRLRCMQDLIVNADISYIKCKLCETEFKTIDNLTEHLSSVHKKVYHETVRKPSHGILGFDLSTDSPKCHVCGKYFSFFKNLSVHMNEHYGLFVCYVCGKKFLSEHRYKCHVFYHHDSKQTKCKHCGDNFKTEAAMAYHIKKEHLKRTIKCPKCPETFPFTQYLKRQNHMALVHGIKKPVFKCDTCGREYANSGSLAAHKRYTHKRPNELRCEICGYITVHNRVMKNHMDVHNGVKNYECEFCKKKFAKPYTLKLHLKIHLNDKRFVCTLCDAAFIQKNSLKNHVKARHPDSGLVI